MAIRSYGEPPRVESMGSSVRLTSRRNYSKGKMHGSPQALSTVPVPSHGARSIGESIGEVMDDDLVFLPCVLWQFAIAMALHIELDGRLTTHGGCLKKHAGGQPPKLEFDEVDMGSSGKQQPSIIAKDRRSSTLTTGKWRKGGTVWIFSRL